MDHYARQNSTSAATNQFSNFDTSMNYDENLQYISSTPNDDYWCPTCTLPYSDCLCYAASPVNFHQDDNETYNYPQMAYQSNYATSTSSTSSYYTASSVSSKQQPSYSTIAPATNSTKASRSSTPSETPKRGKRKGSMAPEEAREVNSLTPQALLRPNLTCYLQKRLEQNRRSQRSFRDRQARLVIDLKHKVEVLTEENEKLVSELSALGLRDSSSRDSKSPATDYSNY